VCPQLLDVFVATGLSTKAKKRLGEIIAVAPWVSLDLNRIPVG